MSLDLPNAIRNASAIRFQLELQPPGGPMQKIFPPTYPSPKNSDRVKHALYATETRFIEGEQVLAIVLDSIPSQANRLEQALLAAHRREKVSIKLPIIEVNIEGYGTISDLEAPHRVYDAILIDSLLDGQPFLSSSVGGGIAAASIRNATDLFTYAPTALIFGAWNSHAGQRTGMARFPRAITSEIIGWPILPGVKTASRIDPLSITKSAGDGMFEAEGGRWTFDLQLARKEKTKPKPTKPSEQGHGNVAPSIDRETGGISILQARQSAVLTLVQLRNLHFPDKDGKVTDNRDWAAQTVLAALALVALLEQWEQGYQLRSGCLLQPLQGPSWNLCGKTAKEDKPFELTLEDAHKLLTAALKEAEHCKLTWPENSLKLVASPALQALVKRNTDMLASDIADEE